MEIRDYLRANAKRLLAIVVAAIAAAAVTFGVVHGGPQRYRATAKAVLPGSSGSTASAVTLVVADFDQAVRSGDVALEVRRRTGVARDAYLAHVGTAQVAHSGTVQLTFTGSNRRVAGRVAEVATDAALARLARPELAVAQRELSAAVARYGRDRAALDDFGSKNGLVLPEQQYQSLSTQLSQVRLELAQAEALGQLVRIPDLQRLLDQRQRQLDEVQARIPEYQRLADDLSGALASRSAATRDALVAQARYDGARGGRLLHDTSVTAISRARSTARVVGAAAALATLVAAAFVLVPDLLGASTERRRIGGTPVAQAD